MDNERYFNVVQRRSVADIAEVAMGLSPSQQESAVLICGDRLPFSLQQKTTFSCSGEDVVL